MSEGAFEVRGLRDDEAGLYSAMVSERGGTPIEYYVSHYEGLGGGWDNSRVVLVDGQIASHVRIYDRVVRWGAATVHCGAMADVYTRPEHRRKGYGRMLLEDSVERYAAWGCGLSMIISGVYEFYSSGGWERYPLYRFDIGVRPEWVSPVPGYRVRRFDRGRDLEAVAEIYAAYNQNSPLSLVRDEAYWRGHFTWVRREREEAFYVAEAEGRVAGYMRGDAQTIYETGYAEGHEAAAQALLEAELRLMRSRRTDTASIYLPYREPLVDLLRSLRYETTQTETTLLRVVNLPRLLETLLPDFRRELEGCDHPAPPQGVLGLEAAGHQATVTVTGGDVTVSRGIEEGAEVLRLSQRQLFALMTGGDAYVPVPLSKPARDLVEALFPRRNPMWWPIDTV